MELRRGTPEKDRWRQVTDIVLGVLAFVLFLVAIWYGGQWVVEWLDRLRA